MATNPTPNPAQPYIDSINQDASTIAGLMSTEAPQAQSAPAAGNPQSTTSAKLLSGTPVTQNREPSADQDINSILEPYINEMLQLGPEYSSEMEYLKPYLLGTEPGTPQSFDQLVSEGNAQESPTGNTAVTAADQAAGNAIENQPAPGFGNVAKAGEQYAATLPAAQPLQAGLGYQKYLQTYGGLPPNTQDWSEQAQQAYQYAMGDSSSSGGLPPPTVAASDKKASAAAQATLDGGSTQGGGNT